jgi:hypothetical protein
MIKRITILFTFVAYSLSLAHSLVPHHHHKEKGTHHHQANDHHHHHDSDDHDNTKNVDDVLTDALAEAAHSPASQFFVHGQISEQKVKNTQVLEFAIAYAYSLTLSDQEPPGFVSIDRQEFYDYNLSSISLLRAPPAIA